MWWISNEILRPHSSRDFSTPANEESNKGRWNLVEPCCFPSLEVIVSNKCAPCPQQLIRGRQKEREALQFPDYILSAPDFLDSSSRRTERGVRSEYRWRSIKFRFDPGEEIGEIALRPPFESRVNSWLT